MEEILGDLNLKVCCIFIDDIIILGKSYEEHLHNIKLVFDKIREANLKLAPGKCEFFKRKVKYVGHIVSEKGIQIDKQKTEVVTSWPKPSTPEDIRRFLGFVGYYRRFIHQFSKISKPLTELMPTPTKKGQKHKTKTKKLWKWGNEQERAFEQLKEKLISAPILGYADGSESYELHTESSGDALGAVLYQEQNGLQRVISYASRSLSKAEKNYATHKRELLALKWAVSDKFKDYLYVTKFTIMTDNNPLTYVFAKLDATGHRWLAALSAFDFDILYRPGKANADADAISRLPADTDCNERCNIPIESIKAICRKALPPAYIDSLAISTDVVIEDKDNRGTNLGNIIDWENAKLRIQISDHGLNLSAKIENLELKK